MVVLVDDVTMAAEAASAVVVKIRAEAASADDVTIPVVVASVDAVMTPGKAALAGGETMQAEVVLADAVMIQAEVAQPEDSIPADLATRGDAMQAPSRRVEKGRMIAAEVAMTTKVESNKLPWSS